MGYSINSALEQGFKTFYQGLNQSDIVDRVYVYLEPTTATTPCLFIVTDKGTDLTYNSGMYRIPVSLKAVVHISDIQNDSGSLDRMAYQIETFATGSQTFINNNSNDVAVLSVTQRTSPLKEVVEQTVQYSIDFDVVAKRKG